MLNNILLTFDPQRICGSNSPLKHKEFDPQGHARNDSRLKHVCCDSVFAWVSSIFHCFAVIQIYLVPVESMLIGGFSSGISRIVGGSRGGEWFRSI